MEGIGVFGILMDSTGWEDDVGAGCGEGSGVWTVPDWVEKGCRVVVIVNVMLFPFPSNDRRCVSKTLAVAP